MESAYENLWNQNPNLLDSLSFSGFLKWSVSLCVVLQGMWSIGKKSHPVSRSLFLGAEREQSSGDFSGPNKMNCAVTIGPRWEYPT